MTEKPSNESHPSQMLLKIRESTGNKGEMTKSVIENLNDFGPLTLSFNESIIDSSGNPWTAQRLVKKPLIFDTQRLYYG
jgi:hypothetical protein